MFGWVKKLFKKVVLLSNMFSNRSNHLVDTFNKKDVNSYYQTRNAISLQLLITERNAVANYFEIEKEAIGRNRVTRYSKRRD